MSAAWESYLANRSGPPSQTEQIRCENAERVVRDALRQSEALKDRTVKTFLQGSYRNNTNVRQESDVDVGVLCSDTYYYDIESDAGIAREDWGWEPIQYEFATYKGDVGAALANALGAGGVTRGNKAFDIHENTYRVDADVAPFFEYRLYYGPKSGDFESGVAMVPDSGGLIINYPEQHHANCVAKNNRTSRRYKEVVRIVKRLRSDLELTYSNEVTGFFIECALFNVSDSTFAGSYYDMTRKVVAEAYGAIETETLDARLREANGIKFLFHGAQRWTKDGALRFLNELFAALHR